MDTERAEAIVLRLQPVTESSLIVTWYSRDFGKLRTMAKGARRPKGPFRGKLDLFYMDEIVFLRSRRSDLHLLHDCFLLTARQALRGRLASLAAASYVCELVELATAPEDVNVRVFDLLNAVLETFGDCQPAVLVIWFELQLLSELGWRPRWKNETATTRVLQSLIGVNLETTQRVKLNATQIAEARSVLSRMLEQELGRMPRSLSLYLRLEAVGAASS